MSYLRTYLITKWYYIKRLNAADDRSSKLGVSTALLLKKAFVAITSSTTDLLSDCYSIR